MRVILNKTKNRIRNTNIRLELGMDEMKNYNQTSILIWFGHMMRKGEERIPNKILHTKNRVKATKRKTHNQMDRLN